jgi:MoxR-like ATPase
MLFWGPPGIGKSSIIEGLGRAYGMHVETLSPGERGEAAFGVVPVPQKKKDGTQSLSYPKPDWCDMFDDTDGKGIVFVDELNTATPDVQPALLGLIEARRIGSHYLGRGVRPLGAANPVEQAAGGWDLPPALANRFGHMSWEPPSAQEWARWLVEEEAVFATSSGGAEGAGEPQFSCAAEEARVMQAWPAEVAKAKGLVAAFVRARPHLLLKQPAEGDPAAGRAWPSPRTWHMATRALASSAIHGLGEADSVALTSAFVGSAAAGEFVEFRAKADLPDPADVLSGKVKWAHEPARLDRTFAVLSACAALLCNTPKPAAEHVETMWRLLDETCSSAKDIVWQAAEPLVKRGIGVNTSEARKVLAALNVMIEARARGRR